MSYLYNKDNYFYLIQLMSLVSCLAQMQHSKITHSYPMNVITLFMVGFLLVAEKKTSAIFKVQYKVIVQHLKMYCN